MSADWILEDPTIHPAPPHLNSPDHLGTVAVTGIHTTPQAYPITPHNLPAAQRALTRTPLLIVRGHASRTRVVITRVEVPTTPANADILQAVTTQDREALRPVYQALSQAYLMLPEQPAAP